MRFLELAFSRVPRTCCGACAYLATVKRQKPARRVRHDERVCANPQCGKTFIPTRADAVTCSNRCRQALYRQRERKP
jgi:hypothetical protein